jgi:hypothetical protein
MEKSGDIRDAMGLTKTVPVKIRSHMEFGAEDSKLRVGRMGFSMWFRC